MQIDKKIMRYLWKILNSLIFSVNYRVAKTEQILFLTHNKSVFFQKISKSVRKTPPPQGCPNSWISIFVSWVRAWNLQGNCKQYNSADSKSCKRQPTLAVANQAKIFFQVFHFLPPYNFLKPPFRCNMISVLIASVIVATFSATASKLILRRLTKGYYTNFTVSRKIK